MNNITLIGRLVRDPESRDTERSSVCNFTVAVDRYMKRDEADFFRCDAWGKTGEFVQKYFKKGDPIAVTGPLQLREYDKRDGTKGYSLEVNVQRASFVPQPPKNRDDSEPSWVADARDVANAETKDDKYLEPAEDIALPFDF